MTERELREKTSCAEINTEQGNLVNKTTSWNITADLVRLVEVPLESLRCGRDYERINAFLPIPELTREEAVDLCHKFGDNVPIAGQFNNKADFDDFHEGEAQTDRLIISSYSCH